MDVFYAYTYSTAAWLGVQAITLITLPKLIITLLEVDAHESTASEIYLSRSLGFSLSLVAVIVLFFTGTIPLSSSIGEAVSLDKASTDPKTPFAVPILRITTMFHVISTVYCYMRYVSFGQSGYLLGTVGYGGLGCLGLWCALFGTGSGHISKRTGADKRTTGFPFRNTSAYDKKKDRKLG